MEETIYIITGITGYVGNVFAKTLMDKGLNVVGLARDENTGIIYALVNFTVNKTNNNYNTTLGVMSNG